MRMTFPRDIIGNNETAEVVEKVQASAARKFHLVPVRLRAWAFVSALLAMAPATIAILAFQVSRNTILARSDVALAAIHSETAHLAISNTIQVNRVAASVTAAIKGAEPLNQKPPTQTDRVSSSQDGEKSQVSWALPTLTGCVIFLSIAASIFAIEYKLARWLRYFRRVALAHSGGRWSARAIGLRRLPAGLADLALQMNHMADTIDARATALEHAIEERTALLQEIHHRVKNNFAIVASLLSLHKKSLPQEFRPDIRFLEEHVHATAIAYRVAYAAKDTSSVPAIQLVREVIEILQDIAGCPPDNISIDATQNDALIGLDKAIALGLCLAYGLPPFLDGCLTPATRITIKLEIAGDEVCIGFEGLPEAKELAPVLRRRLAEAYLRQLDATFATTSDQQRSLRVPLHT